MNDDTMKEEKTKEEIEPILLLKEVYPCISSAISLELDHGNYDEIERLKILRKKIEKIII